MLRLSSTHRIVVGLVSLVVSVLLVAGMCGLIPNVHLRSRQTRTAFCETTAISFMALAPRMEAEELEQTLNVIRRRNPDVLSMALRDTKGKVVLAAGTHEGQWMSTRETTVSHENTVPISADGKPWGQLEVRWKAGNGYSIFGYGIRSDVALTFVVGSVLCVAFSLFLKKTLRQVNPGKVIPNRVRDALNALSEGLLVLDPKHSIVLANDSFTKSLNTTSEVLIGTNPDQFGFRPLDEADAGEMPWLQTAQNALPVKSMLLTRGTGNDQKTYAVSTVPVMNEKNQNRGILASFEDVTMLQRKQEELRFALTSLKSSTDEVRKQNRELEWLATRDTLTGCLNRRSFFHDFESHWQDSRTMKSPMAAVMVDIDHFKAVNDNHGHSTGDEVLREVSAALLKTVSDTDLVCRYGGEEFTILMPRTSIDEAELKAEQCRLAIKALEFEKLSVTASLGVSALCQNPDSPQDLMDQADKCLYVAKRHGRNQVVRWDRAQDKVAVTEAETIPTREEELDQKAASAIPYHAVAALTSALAHRDQATAVHSRRVAEMCVATAEGLLTLRECYVLEIAALLHDIGKIGIPDSVLKKTGRLTSAELDLVLTYNRMGVDMVRGSFGSSVLTEIVEQHVVYYDMSNCERGAGPGHKPSIGARVLAIANAYDTMTSDLSYRESKSRSEAFAELRRCSGTQFDPELVERYITAMQIRSTQSESAGPQVTRESALNIGLMLEQLVSALDDQNVERLQDITASLQITATMHGLEDIARHAQQLHETLNDQYDEIDVMEMAGELLDKCRATQSTLLAADIATVVA